MSSYSARRILKDYEKIQNEKQDLFNVQPNEENINEWRGYLMPSDDTMYFGMIIPFRISFPKDYPNKPPNLQFP